LPFCWTDVAEITVCAVVFGLGRGIDKRLNRLKGHGFHLLFGSFVGIEDIAYIVSADFFNAALGQLTQRPIEKRVLPVGEVVRAQMFAVKIERWVVD
jgi:hypothetical protein